MESSSRYVKLVTSEELRKINSTLIKKYGGEGVGIKDSNLFESLLVGYNQEVFGMQMYPNIEDKIAYIVFSIICNHVFRDGNKRTGTYVLVSLCRKNQINISNINLIELALSLATSKLSIEDLARIIKNNYFIV